MAGESHLPRMHPSHPKGPAFLRFDKANASEHDGCFIITPSDAEISWLVQHLAGVVITPRDNTGTALGGSRVIVEAICCPVERCQSVWVERNKETSAKSYWRCCQCGHRWVDQPHIGRGDQRFTRVRLSVTRSRLEGITPYIYPAKAPEEAPPIAQPKAPSAFGWRKGLIAAGVVVAIFVLFLVGVPWLSHQSHAWDDSDVDFDVAPIPDLVTAGEPVRFRITTRNHSNWPIQIPRSSPERIADDYRVEVLGPGQVATPTTAYFRTSAATGGARTTTTTLPSATIESGGSLTREFVVSRYYDCSAPGQYRVRISQAVSSPTAVKPITTMRSLTFTVGLPH